MKKSTKRSLITSVMALLLCVSMLVGTTYAWFTDSVESGNNVIKAGNLDVDFEYWKDGAYYNVDGATNIFDPNALWEPGHTEVAYLKVSNAGTLALKYRMALTVLGNTLGQTKEDTTIDLTEYINFAIVENVEAGKYSVGAEYATAKDARDAAIAAAEAATRDGQTVGAHSFSEVLDSDADRYAWLNRQGEIIKAAEGQEETVHTFAIVVWMPNSVGNEANHDGVNIPYINLGLSVVATQVENEKDSFGDDFDKDAIWKDVAAGISTVTPGATNIPVEIRGTAGNKVGSGNIPAGAVADGASTVGISVKEDTSDFNFTVATEDGAVAKTLDVTGVGIKEGNTEKITVSLRIDPDLDPDTVKLYHYNNEIPCDYNPNSGYLTFKTTSFSPFTVVYVPDSQYNAPSAEGVEVPKASVVYMAEHVGEDANIEWGNYGQWSPTAGLDAELEAAFKFTCPEITDEQREVFEYWYCDFYVKLDKPLGANQIFLGGNYGSFGWVGFHNGDVTLDANQELGLLESVTTNPWTYSAVEENVGEFICGVGDVNNALDGATFTVMLRLTNPENAEEYYDVNTVTYTFGGDYNIQ